MEKELLFVVRTYGKAELAMLYCPENSPESANKTLYRWIQRCTPLVKALEQINYNPRRHTFLRREVELIISYLGEP